jgi:hypothetical protein
MNGKKVRVIILLTFFFFFFFHMIDSQVRLPNNLNISPQSSELLSFLFFTPLPFHYIFPPITPMQCCNLLHRQSICFSNFISKNDGGISLSFDLGLIKHIISYIYIYSLCFVYLFLFIYFFFFFVFSPTKCSSCFSGRLCSV